MQPTEDYRVDDVPVFVGPVSDDQPDRVFLTIFFRVGSNDEVLAHAGVTRLAHSLIKASMPVELQEYVFSTSNGLFTEFHIAAPAELTNDCVRAVALAVREPNWDLLEKQKQLLSADLTSGLQFPESTFTLCRYGTKGAGSVANEQLAFRYATHQTVDTWIRSRFCRNDASIVTFGDDVRLASFDLPQGSEHDLLINEPLVSSLPALIESDDESLVAFQFTTPSSNAAQLAVQLLIKLIDRRVTVMSALAPHISLTSQLVDSSTRSVTLAIPTPRENAVSVILAVQETFEDAADGRFGDDVLQTSRQRALDDVIAQTEAGASAYMRAINAIFPAIEPLDEATQRLESTTSHEVASVISDAAKSLMVIGPSEAASRASLAPFSFVRKESIVGKRQRMGGLLRLFNRSSLIWSDEGVQMTGKNVNVAIEFANCTALVDRGVILELTDRSGDSIRVFPSGYKNGDAIADAIRQNVAHSVTVVSAPTSQEVETSRHLSKSLKDGTGARGVIAGIFVAYVLLSIAWNVLRAAPYLTEPSWGVEGFLVGVILVLAGSHIPLVRRLFAKLFLRSR